MSTYQCISTIFEFIFSEANPRTHLKDLLCAFLLYLPYILFPETAMCIMNFFKASSSSYFPFHLQFPSWQPAQLFVLPWFIGTAAKGDEEIALGPDLRPFEANGSLSMWLWLRPYVDNELFFAT